MKAGWLDAARSVTLEAVAHELGMELRRVGFGPCPGCGSDYRSRKDGTRRGPCGMTPDKRGWRCHRCDAGGDALDLVSLRLTGARFRDVAARPDGAAVRDWYASRGWCEAAPGRALTKVERRPPPPPPPVGHDQDGDGDLVRRRYPDEEVLAALWEACTPLDRASIYDPAVPWLENAEHGRGLSARELGALDLARVLPTDVQWFLRSCQGGPTGSPLRFPRLDTEPVVLTPLSSMAKLARLAGGLAKSSMEAELAEWLKVYRLAVPMYDATGALRSVRFRAVTAVREVGPAGPRWRKLDIPDGRKAMAPPSATVRGLVLADPVGRAMLAGELDREAWDGWLVVCEGEPDLWTWSTLQRRGMPADAPTWAALGVVSGSWTDDVAARVPSGAKVVLRTHADPAGEKYAERIRRTLAGRCEVSRAVIPGPREED